MRVDQRRSALIYKLPVVLSVLAAAYLLKAFYSQASSEDLIWITGPVAYFAEMFSSLKFVHETGYGWIDFDQQVVIAPACAGVNFMIISFCLSAFQLTGRTRSFVGILALLLSAACCSYALTIFANVLRILLSAFFFKVEFYFSWATPAAVHRLVGTCVFYLLLFAYSRGISACLKRRAPECRPAEKQKPLYGRVMFLMPLFWYLTFSVAVPLANRSFRINPELFLRHAFSVGAATSLLTLLLFIGCRAISAIHRPPTLLRQKEKIEAQQQTG
jgi:exosortase K